MATTSTTTLTVDLNTDLKRRIRMRALELDITLSEAAEAAFAVWLDSETSEHAAQAEKEGAR